MTTVVYMGEKYKAYTSPFWKAVQTSSFDNLADILSGRNCCADSGFEHQVFRLVQNVDDDSEKARIIAELKIVLHVISEALQNCTDNDIVERFFSVIRWIGLKHPFRPCRLSTLDRELCNRFYLQLQSEWFRTLVKETAVTKQNLRNLAKFKKHKYNSWTNYLRSVKKPASNETSYHWSNIPESMKENWASGGVKRAVSVNAFEDEQRKKILSYEKTGPFGSVDPLLPIDLETAHTELNSDMPWALIFGVLDITREEIAFSL